MKINKQGDKEIDSLFSVTHTYLHTSYLAILVDGSQKSNETFNEICLCYKYGERVRICFISI